MKFVVTTQRITSPAWVDCPETATDTDGTVIPCCRAAGHDADHQFIRFGDVENRCGLCGEAFEISETDPHRASGEGPSARGGRAGIDIGRSLSKIATWATGQASADANAMKPYPLYGRWSKQRMPRSD